MIKTQRLGIIQSRGCGDIIIALPIARHYYDQGYDIYWPICEEFLVNFKDHAPWVHWIPLATDPRGEFFYSEPRRRLQNLKCDEIICLYQSLNVVPELSQVPWFQIQKFDEFKYTRAAVPFRKKWTLSDCITRFSDREQAVHIRAVTQPLYYVTHLEGSNFTATPDLSALPPEWQRVDINSISGYSVFDWLKVIEGAQALICLDSVIANMVDQLDISVDKYWIPRSHIHLTPVLGSQWEILEPPEDSLAAKSIFRST